MKPKWQRARLLIEFRTADGSFIGRGALIWVKCEPPRILGGPSIYSHWRSGELCHQSNIAKPADDPASKLTKQLNLAVQTRGLELLPDFAEDVPLIPWEQFLADCRG